MLHERISEAKIAAAAWPAGFESLVPMEPVEPKLEAEAQAADPGFTPAAPDVAAGVGGLIVAAYAGLILVFFAFFTGSFLATMMVTIAAGFVAIFFTVPKIFFALEPDSGRRRPSLSDFMYRGMDTLTGHSSGAEALGQMLIVPVLLTFGLLIMGIAGAYYL